MAKASPALKQARIEAEHYKRQSRQIKAEYDVLKANKLRRNPTREVKNEGGIYNMIKRLYGTNFGRDLERNYSPAKGMMLQFRMNVVGALGKMQLNVPNGEEAAAYFNEIWAPDCDYRDDIHFSMQSQNVVASTMREGDCLAVFDDGITPDDSGKLLTWEADQIMPVTKDVLEKLKVKHAIRGRTTQDNGLIRDEWGKVLGFIATGKRGLTVISDIKDASFWPRGIARLPRNPWRLNQGRGVPSIISAASSFLDVYEMLARELQTAKKAAGDYAYITREDSVDDWDTPGDSPEFLPENDGKTAADVDAEGANSTTHPEARNYENLEAFTGGHTDYGAPGDKVEFNNSKRPNVDMSAFVEAVHCQAGMAMGLARAYALLKADTSYTAFRGDMIMTWQGAFYPSQKWLERDWADWVGVKVLRRASRNGTIKPLPSGWERKISWQWPVMPEVNEGQYQAALAQALKNGATDYSEILGPNWKKRLEGLSEQLDVIRKLGLPLSLLEMKSGGTAKATLKEAIEGAEIWTE